MYVAIDEHGRPTPVRPMQVTNEEQRRRWQDAEQRRAARLNRPDGVVRS